MKGRVVEVEICEREVGFVLSVGSVSLWLAPALAADVLETLALAIALEHVDDGERGPPRPPAAPRRRNFS